MGFARNPIHIKSFGIRKRRMRCLSTSEPFEWEGTGISNGIDPDIQQTVRTISPSSVHNPGHPLAGFGARCSVNSTTRSHATLNFSNFVGSRLRLGSSFSHCFSGNQQHNVGYFVDSLLSIVVSPPQM